MCKEGDEKIYLLASKIKDPETEKNSAALHYKKKNFGCTRRQLHKPDGGKKRGDVLYRENRKNLVRGKNPDGLQFREGKVTAKSLRYQGVGKKKKQLKLFDRCPD